MQSEDKIEYIPFNSLSNPELSEISYQVLQQGSRSTDWKMQFQTLTHLREANRFYSSIFIEELLPKAHRSIVLQVENLRSNNSKEALTLISEIFEHQSIQSLNNEAMGGMIGALIYKSVCEKGFLRSEAMKALNLLPSKTNQYIMKQLNVHTQSNNGVISQLAIKTLCEYVEKHQEVDIDNQFLKALSRNLNGKRTVVQKKSKEILALLKTRRGQKELEELIESFNELSEEESNTLTKQLKSSTVTKAKPQQSLKEYLKMKKSETDSSK